MSGEQEKKQTAGSKPVKKTPSEKQVILKKKKKSKQKKPLTIAAESHSILDFPSSSTPLQTIRTKGLPQTENNVKSAPSPSAPHAHQHRVLSFGQPPSASRPLPLSRSVPAGRSAPIEPFESEDQSYQGILHNAMIGMMSVLLQYTASRTMYNKNQNLLNAIDVQSENIVEEELRKLLSHHQSSNVMTAYSQLSSKLLTEIKSSIIAHPDREKLHELSDHLSALKIESSQVKLSNAEIIARKDQEIEALRADKLILEAKNKSLITAVELLEKELQVNRMAVNDLQQQKVLLKMKCFQYKGDVDQIASQVLKAVKNKIGFLPRNIDVQLSRLFALPPPVDDKIPESGDISVPQNSLVSSLADKNHAENVDETTAELKLNTLEPSEQ